MKNTYRILEAETLVRTGKGEHVLALAASIDQAVSAVDSSATLVVDFVPGSSSPDVSLDLGLAIKVYWRLVDSNDKSLYRGELDFFVKSRVARIRSNEFGIINGTVDDVIKEVAVKLARALT